jgi:hypothetical protein
MKYGSQSSGDASAKKEQWIEEAADERVERLNQLDQILNRPIGSRVNLSREEKLQDWMARLQNPQQSAQEILQRSEAIGINRAVFEFLKWDAQMTKLAGNEEEDAA